MAWASALGAITMVNGAIGEKAAATAALSSSGTATTMAI